MSVSSRPPCSKAALAAPPASSWSRRLFGIAGSWDPFLSIMPAAHGIPDSPVNTLQDPTIRSLMTLPGLDVTVAGSVAAAIGRSACRRRVEDLASAQPPMPPRLASPARLAWREAYRGRRHCAQACNDPLAHAEQGCRIHLGSAGLDRPQVQIGRAACRPPHEPCLARHRLRLQYSGQTRRRTISSRKGGSCLRSSDFPMANEAGKAKDCGKSRRMRTRGYSTTSVCIGLPGAI